MRGWHWVLLSYPLNQPKTNRVRSPSGPTLNALLHTTLIRNHVAGRVGTVQDSFLNFKWESSYGWNLLWRGSLRTAPIPGRAGPHHAPRWRERRPVSQMAVYHTRAGEPTCGDPIAPGR